MYVTYYISKALKGSLKLKNKYAVLFLFLIVVGRLGWNTILTHLRKLFESEVADRLTTCYEYWNIIWDELGFLHPLPSQAVSADILYMICHVCTRIANPLTTLNNVCTPYAIITLYIPTNYHTRPHLIFRLKTIHLELTGTAIPFLVIIIIFCCLMKLQK